jgi:hypothetical protein
MVSTERLPRGSRMAYAGGSGADMNPVVLETRRALGAFLQEQMIAGKYPHAPLADDAQVFTRNSVKAFLIESHLPREPDELRAALRARVEQHGITVGATRDENLVTLEAGTARMWIDVSRGRFWRAFSVDDVEAAKELHKTLLLHARVLDGTWLDATFLDSLPETVGGRAEAFRLGVDRRALMRPDAAADHSTHRLKMKVWHPAYRQHLAFLQSGPLYSGSTSLLNMRLRISDADEEEMVVAEFFDNGRVTATGTSFSMLNDALLATIDRYQGIVEGIEARFGIGRDEHGFHGRTIEIPLDWRVDDIGFAVHQLVRATRPFRLWGMPRQIGTSRWQVWAADLHMAQPLALDFSERSLVIALPAGTCGNTVVRLVSNLQRTLSSNISMAE